MIVASREPAADLGKRPSRSSSAARKVLPLADEKSSVDANSGESQSQREGIAKMRRAYDWASWVNDPDLMKVESLLRSVGEGSVVECIADPRP